jgi:hypothetical protein
VDFYLGFEVKRTGKLWLDEFWLGRKNLPPECKVEMWRKFDDPPDSLRRWAARRYWNHVVDDKLGFLENRLGR